MHHGIFIGVLHPGSDHKVSFTLTPAGGGNHNLQTTRIHTNEEEVVVVSRCFATLSVSSYPLCGAESGKQLKANQLVFIVFVSLASAQYLSTDRYQIDKCPRCSSSVHQCYR